jgi:hypothetical protein
MKKILLIAILASFLTSCESDYNVKVYSDGKVVESHDLENVTLSETDGIYTFIDSNERTKRFSGTVVVTEK